MVWASTDGNVISDTQIRAAITQSTIGRKLWPLDHDGADESGQGLTDNDIDHWYPPGHTLRYEANAVPGTTDLAPAFQLAVDIWGKNVGDNGLGGTVILPPGTVYLGDAVLLYSGIHVIGAGSNATKIVTDAGGPSGHLIRTVDDARHISLKGFRIDGQSNVVCDGGLKLGNDSADLGFVLGMNIDDVIVSGFSKTNAVLVRISNPSDIAANNFIMQTVPNGTACEFIANNTNVGIFAFNACKFGDVAATKKGLRLLSNTGASAGLSEIQFNACFAAGTEYSLLVDLNSAPASVHRGLLFIGCHFETDNIVAGSYCVGVAAGSGILFKNCAAHGFGNTDYGFYMTKGGNLTACRFEDCQGVDIDVDIIHVESSGAGQYERCLIDGVYLSGVATTPSEISDTGHHFKVRSGGKNVTPAANATTFDVYDIDLIRTANTLLTTVTAFNNGSRDKVIHISAGDSLTVIQNNGSIITSTGQDKHLVINQTYSFIYRLGIWFEIASGREEGDTTTALAAIADTVNTTGKYEGKQVFNTTTNKPVWAAGSTAGSVWVDATGATAHTPI